jgi:uncharacterized protein (DUF58 family)
VTLIFRALYVLYRILSWVRATVRRRFTYAGIAVLIGLCITAVLGIDTEHNVEYQAFAFLAALILVSTGFGWFFSGRFSAERVLPRFGTVGAPLNYQVRLRNLTARKQEGLDVLEALAEPIPSFREWMEVQLRQQHGMRSFRFEQRHRMTPFRAYQTREAAVPPLAPNGESDVTMQITPLRRGPLRFKGLVLGRPDPLGLFRAVRKLPLRQSALILPRRYRLPSVALPGTVKYQEGGVAMASSVGQSDEFVSLRDYRHGDPVRHIHWRSWARVGEPVVKEFEDEFFVRHALVLDTFSELRFCEAFEEAVSVAASFACTIQTQESLLDLLFAGTESYCFTSGRGLAHNEQMLEVLASVEPCRGKKFNLLESLVLEHSHVLSGCVCVLLDWDKDRQEFVRKLRLLGLPVLVLVVTSQEKTQGLDLGPMADQPNRFHTLRCGRIEQDLASIRD